MGTAALHQLAEALDELAAQDLDPLTDGELNGDVVELLRLRHRVDFELARRAARWDERMVWLSDGSRSAAVRLSRDTTVSDTEAKRVLRRGHALGQMAVAAASRQAGRISGEQIDLLAAAAAGGRDELFTRDEAVLVEDCEQMRHRQLVKAITYWIQRADAELGNDGTPPTPPSCAHVTTTFEGAVTGDFQLHDPIDAATFMTVLQQIERDLSHQDHNDGIVRAKSERLAAALVEMAKRAATPNKKGRRPEPLLLILAGEAAIEHLCELSTGTVIHPGFVVPHLSHVDVQTLIFHGPHRVLAASKSRTFRGTLRRAIQARDRHCQHPSGCDAPIADCDLNHVTPYAQGGATDERDGNLQCGPHNRHADLHDKAPPEVQNAIDAARTRRDDERQARQRLHDLTRDQRPPPDPT